jgi:DNA-binding NtrC family response regulator
MRAFCQKNGIPIPEITQDGYRALANYFWEGNVRELKNTLESMVILERGQRLDAETIRRHLSGQRSGAPQLPVHVGRTSDQLEREMVYRALLDLRRDVAEVRQMLLSGVSPRVPSRWQRGVVIEEAGEVPLSLEEAEKEQIQRALEEFGGNRRKTAEALGIGERTLYRKIKQYGL